MSSLTEDRWCDALDRRDKIADLPLSALRKMADAEKPLVYWTRGKCLAEILATEFDDCFAAPDRGAETS